MCGERDRQRESARERDTVYLSVCLCINGVCVRESVSVCSRPLHASRFIGAFSTTSTAIFCPFKACGDRCLYIHYSAYFLSPFPALPFFFSCKKLS